MPIVSTSYKEGQSGNPAGKAPGTKNKMTELREHFMKSAPAIVTLVLERAEAGDEDMIKLALERIMPKKREETYVKIPNFVGKNYAEKCKALDEALESELISVEICEKMCNIINKRFELEEIDRRLTLQDERIALQDIKLKQERENE